MIAPGVVLGHEPPGLQRNRRVATDSDLRLDDPTGAPKRLLDVPVAHAQGRCLVRGFFPELRGTFLDRLSDVPYPVSRQHGLQKVIELVLGARAYRDWLRPGEVLTGKHLLDPWEGERRVRSNVHDPGVGVGGAEHPHPQLSRAVYVVDEVPEATQQATVFEAPHPAPDRAHWSCSPASRRGDTPSTRPSGVSKASSTAVSSPSPLPAASSTAATMPW